MTETAAAPSAEAASFTLAREIGNVETVAVFTIDGEPASKSRARFDSRGSKVRAYTPEKTKAAEEKVAWLFRSAAPNHRPDSEHEYGVFAIFFAGTKQRRDVDNMLKLICDGLNKVAWNDDSQVAEVSGRRGRDFPGNARTEVWIYRTGRVHVDTQPCVVCGKEFRTYASWRANPNGKKYCSRDCVSKHRIERRARTCKHCGGEFLAWGESSERTYCSVACKSASARATVLCDQCGTSFTKLRCHVRKTNYCSEDCRLIAAAARRSTRFPGTCRICGGGTTRKEYTRCDPCRVSGKGA